MKKIALALTTLTLLITTSSDSFAWHRRSYCGWYDRRCGNIRSSDYNRCYSNCGGCYSSCYYNTINRYNPIYPTFANCCYPSSCMQQYGCPTNCCNYSVSSCGTCVSRVEENPPCSPAPCCLKTIQVPANLVQKVEYYWECPQNCNIQNSCCPQQGCF
jgi:hypothetical protein